MPTLGIEFPTQEPGRSHSNHNTVPASLSREEKVTERARWLSKSTMMGQEQQSEHPQAGRFPLSPLYSSLPPRFTSFFPSLSLSETFFFFLEVLLCYSG